MRRLASMSVLFLALSSPGFEAFAQAPSLGQTKALFPGAAPAPAHALGGKALLAALRQGGYVLYFRHTATDFSKNDSRMQGMDDCANQRPLSDLGRAQAKDIGSAIRKLKLPIADVQASPYCRTVETATLAFGKTEKNVAVRGDGGNYDALGKLLSEPAPAQANRAVVGHGNGMRALAGAPHLEEGEAAVIKPGKEGPVIVARIRVGDWAALDKL